MLQNKRFQNMFKLSSRITVYVPSTIDVNKDFDNTEYVNKTHELLSTCFGGSTETKAVGCWISKKEGLVKESTTMVFSYCTESALDENIDKVYEWCLQMQEELAQESIAVEINGELYLLSNE